MMRVAMGDPCRYDANNLSDADITEINHLLFDPAWRHIANPTWRF